MAPRTIASRSAALALAALVIGSAVWASEAAAQEGNGLYEPFPEAAVKKRAQRYVERLGRRTPDSGRRPSDAQLARGVFVRPGPGGPALVSTPAAARPGAASARAGGGGSPEVALPLQLLLLALALALPAAAVVKGARAHAA